MYFSAGAPTGSSGSAGKLDHEALGPPAHGARHVQRRGAGEPPGSTKERSGSSSAFISSISSSSRLTCASLTRSGSLSRFSPRVGHA